MNLVIQHMVRKDVSPGCGMMLMLDMMLGTQMGQVLGLFFYEADGGNETRPQTPSTKISAHG